MVRRHTNRDALKIEVLEDCNWKHTWLERLTPMRFGEHLWIRPGGQILDASPDAAIVDLDPGLAFGTGTHPTTALCLESLDAHPPERLEVIDFGCGSGILGIAALKLGARHVEAIDHDPQAVLANILANVLIERASHISRLVSPGGTLVLSGISADQAVPVTEAYRHIIDFQPIQQREGWILWSSPPGGYMRTRCPHCHTAYDVDPQILQQSQGLARCYRCTQVFNAFQNAIATTPEVIAEPHPLDTSSLIEEKNLVPPDTPPSEGRDARRNAGLSLKPSMPLPGNEPTIHGRPNELPSYPDTWAQAAPDPASNSIPDEQDLLYPPPPRSTPWWQKLMVLLLSLSLLTQLAWIQRDLWIDLPQTTQLCAIFDCQLPDRYHPQDFTVIERTMESDAGPPAALHLWLAIRNDAPFAQPLPRLQLTLQDATGALVARRLFSPDQYLPPGWSGPPTALPEDVITIDLHLKDPGPRAQGFVIDFL